MLSLIAGRKVALGLSAAVLAGGGIFVVSAPAGAAAATGQAEVIDSPTGVPSGCITWKDSRGPGHGDRRHAQCLGAAVLVEIYCNTGTSLSASYRPDYNKAECPGYGGKERSFNIDVLR
ncbi:hypothetical protein [Streptomyces olivoreticuli]|uniref:hypothetical protein n=1 Tax=Streptomyces olivoreticuli TaxID=68246 RepID=UPI0013C32570|nr:hypothetical protein [Streptomyces olivoreticuli]